MLEHPVLLAGLDVEGQPAPEVLVTVTDDILTIGLVLLALSLHLGHLGVELFLRLVFCLTLLYGSLVVAPDVDMVYGVDLLDGEQLLLAALVVHTIDVA